MALDLGTIFHRALFPVGTGRQMVKEYNGPMGKLMAAGRFKEGRIDTPVVAGYRLSQLEVPPDP